MDEYDSRPDPRLEVSICEEDGLYDLRVGEDNFTYPGLVLIFNQTVFHQDAGPNSNSGSTDQRLIKPGVDLEELMTALGFKVFYHLNYTRVQIMNTITKYATLKRRDRKDYASFMLFFLSHGNIVTFESDFHEIIKTADDDMLISDTWKHFENTATWNNKPKCFFFQVCRGMDLTEGVKVESRESLNNIKEYDSAHFVAEGAEGSSRINFNNFNNFNTDMFERHESLDPIESFVRPGHSTAFGVNRRRNFPFEIQHPDYQYNVSRTAVVTIPSIPFTEPKFSDLLILHSTYQGAASFQETDYSPFVNAIDTNFRNDFFKLDLFSIVQNVQKEIAYTFHASERADRDAVPYDFENHQANDTENSSTNDIKGSRLMPMIESTLTGKICYQNPNNIQVGSFIPSQELPKHYDMKSGKGRAVIFANKYKNMEKFPQMPYVVSDIEGLKTSFGMLQCETTIHWDLSKNDFLIALNDLHAQDYSQHDFLIVVFYGYGFKDFLIVRNQQDAFEEDYVEVAELWQPFLGSRCQTLIDKPKFFIVSAIGIDQPGVSGKFKRFVKKDVNIGNTRALNDEARCEPGETPNMYVIPEASDILLLFHTTSGTANYMDFMDDCMDLEDADQGPSSFFHKLNKQLQNGRNFAGDRHLLDIIRKFQYDMTMLIKNNVRSTREGRNKREVPLVFSTLTKNFVLQVNQLDN